MPSGRVPRNVVAVALIAAAIFSGTVAAAPGGHDARPATEWRRWSDRATWESGAVPKPGAHVRIPRGSTVVLDTSPPPLGSLTIEGALVFDDKNLELVANTIMVHGRLQVGTADRPFRSRAVITLAGRLTANAPKTIGSKVLAVMGGTLDLHGDARGPAWTRLAQTASKGASRLVLERPVDWKHGDVIVVASTDFNPLQAEEAIVKAVRGNVVTLDRQLAFMHYGASQTFAGVAVDERAEVGLLTRNVVVQGDTGSAESGAGGHVMIMEGSVARIQWAEFHRMGQKKILGRYPVHFHMAGDASGSYVRYASIHHSFNRCFTIHGTHGVHAQGNVAYDTVGHCYFLEDGVETHNVLEGNLGLVTRAAEEKDALLKSDMQPATFWISHPTNVFRGNVAAGSQSFGFWFAMPKHPTGLSRNSDTDREIWPRRMPLGAFHGNVAHSNDNAGLFVDGDGSDDEFNFTPRENAMPPEEGHEDSPPVTTAFTDVTAYKNRSHGIWLKGEHLVVKGARLADNAIGATFASSQTFIESSIVIGETANKGTVESGEAAGLDKRSLPMPWAPEYPIRGFEFFWEHVGARRVTFVNFTPNAKRAASGLAYPVDNPYGINVRNFAEAVRFVNANQVYLVKPNPKADGDKSALFVDKDGSVTGVPGAHVVVNNPFMIAPGCARRAPWNAYVCQGGSYGRLSFNAEFEKPTPLGPIIIRREDSGAAHDLVGFEGENEPSTFFHTGIMFGRTYRVQWKGAGPPHLWLFAEFGAPGEWVRLALPYAGRRFEIHRNGDAEHPLARARSLAELDASPGDRYYSDGRFLYVKIAVQDGEEGGVALDIYRR
ncbi:MAG: G8 domain-containing protein [Armatimonadota bacterium]